MNIEVNDSHYKLVEKICKETEMNPPQLMEFFMDIIQHLYFDYEEQKNAEVEKKPFKEILTNLFLHSFKSKLRTLDIAENLIESTNELLGIKGHVGAIVHNINPDFDKRSISYSVGYDFCVDAASMYAYRALVIEVEINQDHIEVSHVVCIPTFESMEITDKKLNDTSNLIQNFFEAICHDEFSPFANIEVKILPIRDFPYVTSEPIHYIEIKLIVKADKAEYIPSIEKIGPIAGRVHSTVVTELHLKG
jgi:hypothetical protein